MNVVIERDDRTSLPRPVGGHELAWSHMLDAAFADAYLHDIGELRVAVPRGGIADMAEVRARAALAVEKTEAGVALLCLKRAPAREITRLYRIDLGVLARCPKVQRCKPKETDSWRLERSIYTYTASAAIWGVGSRLAARYAGPALADRCHLSMRRDFISSRPSVAFYVLSFWSRR